MQKNAVKIPLYPYGIERKYNALLQRYVETITHETEKRVKERGLLKLDGFSEDLTALLASIYEFAISAANPIIFRLPEIYTSVNVWQDREWRLVVKAGTGIDLPSSGTIPSGMVAYGNVSDPSLIRARFGVGIDVYRAEPWLTPRMNNWIDYNTSLIKSIPTQYIGKVESAIRNGVMQGIASSEIAKEIKRISGVTSNRARVIARDQISKANNELNEYRQKDLGIDDYKWWTSQDERVRPTHKTKHGKVFKWSNPPSDTGHPGHDVLCRCVALPEF